MDGFDARLYGPWEEGKESPLREFEKKLCIVKVPQHGGAWNGPELKKVVDKLDLLEDLLPESLNLFMTVSKINSCAYFYHFYTKIG